MSGETWTEYGVRHPAGYVAKGYSLSGAERFAAEVGGTVVGRTVTASPWLPVQEQA